MSTALKLKPGARVLVPWGLDASRQGTVVEVWGDPQAPTHVRVELDPLDADEEPAVLLLNPALLTAAA